MKTNRFAWAMAISLLACPVVTSCSSDDDGNDGGEGAGLPGVTVNGQLLTQAGEYRFSYDSSNRCTKIEEDDSDDTVINYSNATMSIDGDIMKFKRNGDGYISEITGEGSYREDGTTYTYSGKYTMSYDSNGHITSVKGSDKETGSDNSSYTSTDETNCTWQNGNLTKIRNTYIENEDGTIYTSSLEINFEYGNVSNSFLQYTYATSVYGITYENGDFDPLAFVGLFGKGTSNFPVKATIAYSYDGIYTNNQVYTFDYTTASNGTVSSETVTVDYGESYSHTETYSYRYKAASEVDRSIGRSIAPATNKAATRNPFRHTRRAAK